MPTHRDVAENRAAVSRRHFLRGVGTCIALPALGSLRPGTLLAAESSAAQLATTPTGAPLRTAFVFFPNGSIPSGWWPSEPGSGDEFKLSPTLEPLAAVKDYVQVLGGLDHQAAEPGPDGAGDHARGNGTFLTGVRLRKSATDIHAGVSIDQMIANRLGHVTRFPSLELTGDVRRQTRGCDSGYACAYQYNISWSSPTTPMTPEANPRLVFERLFGAGPPGERSANLERRRQQQQSVLDFVLQDARAMRRRLDSRDREKIDQYLHGVREVELGIDRAERFGKFEDPGVETPAGIPQDYEEYLGLMYDMLVLAFQTDTTRVATFLLAHDGSNRSFEQIGISEGHHDLTHHQNRESWIEKVQEIDRWYVRQFARFVKKLHETKDVDGNSLLDNSMIVYGGGNADANRHTHSNLPIVMAGGGGGSVTPGRYISYGSQPATNLFLSMADRVGVTGLDRFGDSTGRLADV